MKNNLEYRGEWFLPSKPEKGILAILYFDNEQGGRLELIGSFSDDIFIPTIGKYEIILGITSESKEITLYNSFAPKSTGLTLSREKEIGKPLTTIIVNFIFEGIHTYSLEDLRFEKLISEINNLDEWINISGFQRRDLDLEKRKRHEIEIQYKAPEQIKFNINDTLKGTFNFVANNLRFGSFEKEITITQKVELIIESNVPFTIEDGLRTLISFQNFIILGLYQHAFPSFIKLHSKKFETKFPDGYKSPIDIKLYFTISDNRKRKKNKDLYDMLFSYGHIKNEFQSTIKNWFKKYETLEPAFDLVFEQFYSNERFSTNTFLNLAKAAETFHARLYNHTKFPKTEFKKMKEVILQLTPTEYHKRLNDQFNFGNNLNLYSRLIELCDKYSNSVLDKVIGEKEIFVKQVKNSRNYYTHYSDISKAKALEGQELYILTEKLKILLVSAFLLEVGFERTLLENLLENNKHRFFNHLIKW